jgi:plastocyanin
MMTKPILKRTFLRLAVLALLVTLTGACKGEGDRGDSSGSAAVQIKLFRFDPDPLRIEKGTTVMWTNRDEILHTVTSGKADEKGDPLAGAGSVFDGTMEGRNTTFTQTFVEAGTFPYFCRRHATAMAGSVIVD